MTDTQEKLTSNQQKPFELFSALHNPQDPLVLINIWDAASAKIVEGSQHKALATSSASLAWSLGYADGYQLPKQELLAAIRRITRVTNTPITVDIENGYSTDINQVVTLVKELADPGVVGINIEDGTEAPELLSNKISAIKTALPHLFINARTDVYLANLVKQEQHLEETMTRLRAYSAAGADGLFIPGLTDTNIARQIQQALQKPVNLMALEESQIRQFAAAQIPRISVGPASFIRAYQGLEQFSSLAKGKSSEAPQEVSYVLLNQLLSQ